MTSIGRGARRAGNSVDKKEGWPIGDRTADFTRFVHLPWGYVAAGRRVCGVCSCGYITGPRVDKARAQAALLTEHGYTAPVCALCGTDHHPAPGRDWGRLRHRDVEVRDVETGGTFLVCRGVLPSRRNGADRRRREFDTMVADKLGADPPGTGPLNSSPDRCHRYPPQPRVSPARNIIGETHLTWQPDNNPGHRYSAPYLPVGHTITAVQPPTHRDCRSGRPACTVSSMARRQPPRTSAGADGTDAGDVVAGAGRTGADSIVRRGIGRRGTHPGRHHR